MTVKPPRIAIATVIVLIVLLAVDCALLRSPFGGNDARMLRYCAIPMANRDDAVVGPDPLSDPQDRDSRVAVCRVAGAHGALLDRRARRRVGRPAPSRDCASSLAHMTSCLFVRRSRGGRFGITIVIDLIANRSDVQMIPFSCRGRESIEMSAQIIRCPAVTQVRRFHIAIDGFA
jgi:hypothetical protein